MPKLIKLHNGHADWANDPFTTVSEEDSTPDSGDVIVPFARFRDEGESLLGNGRNVGVLMQPDEAVEDLAPDLPRLSLVALAFPKFKDGRGYSSARLLRERYGFSGEVRAVGEVLREQASFYIRCGFDAFEPADGSTPDQWMKAAGRIRPVYQRAADDREPAYVERSA